MDARNTVAQITGSLPNSESPKVIKLSKPPTDQAIIIHLDGVTKLDLSAIGNENITFVHAGDRLVILFDNHSTATIEPFYDSKGLPLADITVELSSDRDVSASEFASLFPITTDQSILPAAGAGSPAAGANFEAVTVTQFAAGQAPLALLTADAANGNGGPTNAGHAAAINLSVQGPTLGVHDVAGSEDKPIALGLTDALSLADPRTSLGDLTITGVPAGVTLSAGTHNADGSFTLTPAQLAGLTLISDGEVQHFTLTVTGTTLDGGITASSSATINVSVAPVADHPTLSVVNNSGNEDTPIALSIATALGEVDADAVLSVTIKGLPTSGVTLSNANHDPLTIAADGSITLTPAQLAGLALTSDGEVQHFDLTVTATTVDGQIPGTPLTPSQTVSTSATLHVDVALDQPTVSATSVSAIEDQAITLKINAGLTTPDANLTETVTISGIPAGVTLSNANHDPLTIGSDGSITLTPSQLNGLTLTSDGETQHFDLTVTVATTHSGDPATDIQASTSTTLHVDVTPVADAPLLTVPNEGPEQSFILSPVVVPGAASVDPLGINDNGTVVGTVSGQSSGPNAFIDQAGSVTIFSVDSASTQANGINDNGDVVGTVTDADGIHGFLQQAGTGATSVLIDEPGAASTVAKGINNNGEIVGFFADINSSNDSSTDHGFLRSSDGTIVTIDDPHAGKGANQGTIANGINDAGTIVGQFVDGSGAHGFIDQAGKFTTVNVKGASLTEVTGIDNKGDVVGIFEDTTGEHGFFRDTNGNVTVIDAPGAIKTDVFGISASGQIVGDFEDSNGNIHAFTGTLIPLGTVSGNEETPIKLGITAALSEIDHDAVLSVTISGIPTGATLSDDGTPLTVGADGSVTLTGTQIADLNKNLLTLTSDGETPHFNLTVTATTVDGGDVATEAFTSATLHVDVTPVVNAPHLDLNDDKAGDQHKSHIAGNEDQKISLDIAASLSEADPDATLTVTISDIPDGVSLFDDSGKLHIGKDGSITLTPEQLEGLALKSDGNVNARDFTLDVTATTVDGGEAASTSGTIHVDVTQKPHLDLNDDKTGDQHKSHIAGNEDQKISLDIDASKGEADPDATLTVTISDIPDGVSLFDDGGKLHVGKDGSVTLTPAQLKDLSLKSDADGSFTLHVTATTVDGGDIHTAASTSGTIHVEVASIPLLAAVNSGGADVLSGGAGANTFVFDGTALGSAPQSTSALAKITNFSNAKGDTIDLSALLDAAFDSNPSQPASNLVKVTENANGHSATLSVDTGAGTNNQFVAIAHLDHILSGAIVTAILDHAHHTAQLHVA
jgi:large repetitive protein